MKKPRARLCPCGSRAGYRDCCRRLHDGESAAGPEGLLRSRYAAFALGNSDYVWRTWHPDTRPPRVNLDSSTKWTKLEVLNVDGGSHFHTSATVTFRAHYVRDGERGVQAETSRFTRVDGAWRYLAAVPEE